MFSALRRRLPRLGRFPRLCGVGICLLLALESATTRSSRSAASTPAPTTAVVVAARALPVGRVLTRDDLRVVRWPRSLRPAAARADPAGLVGRRLTGPLARGEPVTATRLLGRELATGLPTGLVAVAVPLADSNSATLVQPGDSVDVLASPRDEEIDGRAVSGRVTTLSRDALALAVLPDDAAGGDGSTAEVVVAVPRADAVAISRAAPSSLFTVVLVSP